MHHKTPTPLSRRGLAATVAAALLSRCAAVPEIQGLTPDDIGLKSRGARPNASVVDTSDALQQQYLLQSSLSAAPLVFGNQVTLLPSAAEAFQGIFKAIKEASNSINLEYFILADIVSDGVHLSELLLDRLGAGVRVNISYDGFGSRDTPATFFETLRKAGAKVIEYNPLNPFLARIGWSPNDRDHRKIAVIDGRIGFTGGVNLDKAYEIRPAPAFRRTATHATLTGATSRFALKGRPLRSCRSCSSAPGASRRHPMWTRPTTSRRCSGRACRPSASSAARPATSSRCITPRC